MNVKQIFHFHVHCIYHKHELNWYEIHEDKAEYQTGLYVTNSLACDNKVYNIPSDVWLYHGHQIVAGTRHQETDGKNSNIRPKCAHKNLQEVFKNECENA